MKHLVLLSFALVFAFCKKEEKKMEPTVVTPVEAPQLSAKINGLTYTCSACFSSYESGGLYGINFGVGGNGDRFIINFNNYPTTGTYSLEKFGNPSFNYQKDNTYYRGRGLLSITAIDSSSNGAIRALNATFSCLTDTTGQTSFNISEGTIHVNN